MESLYLIGFVQTIFFSLLILTKKKPTLSDMFLCCFILVMGFRLLGIYIYKLGIYYTYPNFILLKFVYWPLLGPFLYLYICSITSKTRKFKTKYLIHFIPSFLILLMVLIYAIFFKSFHINNFIYPGIGYITGMFSWFCISFFYYFISIIKLIHLKKEIKDYFSYSKNIDLDWLRNLTYGFGLFLLLSFVFIISKETLGVNIFGLWEYITWIIITLYIFGIGYFGYKQKSIFTNFNEIEILIEKDGKYNKTKLGSSESDEILNNLLQFMEKEKPYLNSELNLMKLSKAINTTPHKLSQVINTKIKKNFFEFVNEYRIKQVITLFNDPNYNFEKIMSIAYDCGFNSKSTFFSVFKRMMNQTPTEFRKQQSNSNNN